MKYKHELAQYIAGRIGGNTTNNYRILCDFENIIAKRSEDEKK